MQKRVYSEEQPSAPVETLELISELQIQWYKSSGFIALITKYLGEACAKAKKSGD
jgi:hypothetical protein